MTLPAIEPESIPEASTEIERKFRLEALPMDIDLESIPGVKIDQGYLVVTDEEEVRVRRKGEKCFITYKRSTDHAAERIEIETELTQKQFEILWPGTEGRRLEKTRYKIPFGDFTIEIDVFEGDNAGHILAEVEFTSRPQAEGFQPPDWLGVEVTGDESYDNARIATQGFPK